MPERADIPVSTPATEAAVPAPAPAAEPERAAAPAGEGAAEPRSRRRWPLALLLLGVLLLAAAGALWLAQPDDGMEPNVIVGPMGDYTQEEIEAMLRDKVDSGMIAFSINAQPVMDSPDAAAPLLFENPGNNAKLLRLQLVRDDTGQTVYETGYLAPGTYVGKDELDVRLEPGSYTCTATISAFREDTRAPLGKAAAVALAATLSVPAFAADRTGDMTAGNEQTTTDGNNSVTTKDYSGVIEPGDTFSADTVITADVKAPTAKVISVTLPSTMSIAIGTKFKVEGGTQKTVFDASNTHEVAAAVKNASRGTAVDVSVANVTDSSPASLATLLLKLTPSTSATGATAGSAFQLVAGRANASMVTGLPGLAEDGTGTPGEATLTLSTDMVDNTTVLAEGRMTITTTLKVAVPATP